MTMIYTLVHKSNGAKVRSTSTYLNQWLARGFEVVEIEDTSKSIIPDRHNPKYRLVRG